MANKINKKFSLGITGILNLDDGIPKLDVEDVKDSISLTDVIKEFDGKEIKLTLKYQEKL